ncbi:MAG: hypothetical protein KAH84_10850 [Thiomargarita sp.]|nr:hypothetical protein [Thiomargarita sp.]
MLRFFKQLIATNRQIQSKQEYLLNNLAVENQTSYHKKTHYILQSQLNNSALSTINLIPQEYAGPFFIRRNLTIDGQGSTLWALQGPVLYIDVPNVTLKNLNIEVTGNDFNLKAEECAIFMKEATTVYFENVQVRGQVIGLAKEKGQWQYPYLLELGELKQRTIYETTINISVPTKCCIESAIEGVQVIPAILEVGDNIVSIKVEALVADTILYGYLYLKTAQLQRQIKLTAYITNAN